DEIIIIPYEEYVLDYFFDYIIAGVENVIPVYDTVTGVLEIFFVTNKDISYAQISVRQVLTYEENTYKSFSIDGLNIDGDDLDTFYITYGVERSWIESYPSDTLFVLEDEYGNQYELIYASEDDDFYYFNIALEDFGKFSLKAIIGGASSYAPEEEVEEDVEEESGIAAFAAAFSEGDLTIGLWAFFQVLITGVGMMYVSRLGLAFVLSRKQLYNLTENDFQTEESLSMKKLKYYVYQNSQMENLKERLVAQGYDNGVVNNVIRGVNNLDKSELANYLYAQLAQGKKEDELVDLLVSKGWEDKKVREVISKFERI
ncbi:MAG: hypothetical protein Q8Q35_02190, partial [Nanoarchaeota archaeon]|nr:hypothetical protein [Nanoarchaeota archaeon]